ncbi:hypothetical protein BV349_04348 [Pseudomonas syringae pv. actinidiae]|nr:hypothetical protein BV349_04348 [Pseudomonas syringae pv. actinidiae]OSN73400.1 hypothetical protein BV351_04460 [Pseudomonas syringae pv. actinidiae]RMS16927.1 hypothetical protein ALP75_205373 [Pseudomonas syringae pv. actinidiae]
MCSHYEAPSPHQVAEAFGVAQIDQVRLDLWPGYIGPSYAALMAWHVTTILPQQWKC